MCTIIGIKLSQRMETSTFFQEILSEYGCNIRTRLGLHNIDGDSCATDGIILLDVKGDEETLEKMTTEFQKIAGLKLEIMHL